MLVVMVMDERPLNGFSHVLLLFQLKNMLENKQINQYKLIKLLL